jgi:predicted aminopeptidase
VSETTTEKFPPSTDSATLRESEISAEAVETSGTRNRWFNTRNNEPLNHAADRNGQFRGLSTEEKERVRCIEYQAVKLLAYIVPAYFIFFQLFGCLALGGYMAYNKAEVAIANSQNPW